MTDPDVYRVAEAMRTAAAELASRNADLNRRNGFPQVAETQESVAARIRRVNVGALVDAVRSAPPPAANELVEFEKEARRLYIADFRRNADGEYSYGLTQRFWEMWRAGGRFAAGSV
jgi:hypothetical protein